MRILWLLMLVGVGCRSKTQAIDAGVAAPKPASTMSADVEMNLEVIDVPKPTLRGTTNLPDGTSIMCSVADERWYTAPPEESVDGGYLAQDDGTVKAGRFSCGPFSNDGARLPAGNFEAQALVPYPSTQTETVRAFIGENGEHLHGKLVERKNGEDPIVRLKKRFAVAR